MQPKAKPENEVFPGVSLSTAWLSPKPGSTGGLLKVRPAFLLPGTITV